MILRCKFSQAYRSSNHSAILPSLGALAFCCAIADPSHGEADVRVGIVTPPFATKQDANPSVTVTHPRLGNLANECHE